MAGESSNSLFQSLLTDFYQLTMAYAYWKSGKTREHSVFDLYFRKNPFDGEFTIFAGLSDCVKFLETFKFKETDIDYLKKTMPPNVEDAFFDYLLTLDASEVTLYSMTEGSVCFPRVPLIRVEGPLIISQLLETTLLNIVNYASLVATNAARIRLAAGPSVTLLEFGLRRAQGPDGGLSASRYAYMGGFDGTSNVLAGKMFGIPLKGTHAHAFVASFCSREDVLHPRLKNTNGEEVEFLALCEQWLQKLVPVLDFLADQTHCGEFAAFVSYAVAFPKNSLCLIDTYDVLKSGVPNFCAVALALNDCGYRALGVRIDSGDLSYLSLMVREKFQLVGKKFQLPWFADLTIVASNDINEDTVHSLNQQGHSINSFGIGTHLVTCQKQPALGCVYKLVELNGCPTMKLSEDIQKMTIPGRKLAFRLYSKEGVPLVDFMQRPDEPRPPNNERVLCRHPYHPSKRAYVTPARIEPLYKVFWSKKEPCEPLADLDTCRRHAANSVAILRNDHKRALNPTPYKVSVSDSLYNFILDMWLQCAPIGELS